MTRRTVSQKMENTVLKNVSDKTNKILLLAATSNLSFALMR